MGRTQPSYVMNRVSRSITLFPDIGRRNVNWLVIRGRIVDWLVDKSGMEGGVCIGS